MNPGNGKCALCRGRIRKGQYWTLTGQLNRVHADPDNCIAVLRPSITKKFLRANPTYADSPANTTFLK